MSNLLREKQGNHQQPSDLVPSNLPLQGGKGFSRSSSKLSSLEGVWQPKSERMRREKRENEGPKQGPVTASFQKLKTFVNSVLQWLI